MEAFQCNLGRTLHSKTGIRSLKVEREGTIVKSKLRRMQNRLENFHRISWRESRFPKTITGGGERGEGERDKGEEKSQVSVCDKPVPKRAREEQ